MKTVTILLLLLFASSAYGELTKEDLRTIVKEESAASEKRMKEYIDLKVDALDDKLSTRIDALEKSMDARFGAVDNSLDDRFDAVDKKLDWVWFMMIGLIGLVTAAIAVPQIMVAYRGRKDMQTQIDQLREQIESMQPPPS